MLTTGSQSADRKGTQTLAEAASELKQRMATQRQPQASPVKPPYTGPCREDCPICSGAGLVRLDVPTHDPRFGKLEPCPNVPVENRHTEWRNGLYLDEEDRLSWSIVQPLPLQSLTVNGRAVSPATAQRAAEGVKHYLDQGWGMIYLYGPWGIAKSLIVKIAVAEALRAGKGAVYARMSDILDNLRLAFDERNPNGSAIERMNRWSNVPILAIDEFEKFNPTNWVAERVFQLFDRRYNDAVRRLSVTLVASNKKPIDIDPAIASRAHDGRLLYVEMIGKDARPAMGGEDLF